MSDTPDTRTPSAEVCVHDMHERVGWRDGNAPDSGEWEPCSEGSDAPSAPNRAPTGEALSALVERLRREAASDWRGYPPSHLRLCGEAVAALEDLTRENERLRAESDSDVRWAYALMAERDDLRRQVAALTYSHDPALVAVDAAHGNGPCDDCGGANPVWFTDSERWNAVAGPEVLCPRCFIVRCVAAGINPAAWYMRPEGDGEPDAVRQVAAVRALHVGAMPFGGQLRCKAGCGEWPCATVAALDNQGAAL